MIKMDFISPSKLIIKLNEFNPIFLNLAQYGQMISIEIVFIKQMFESIADKNKSSIGFNISVLLFLFNIFLIIQKK